MQAMNEAEDACSYTVSFLKFAKKLGPRMGIERFEFRSSGGGASSVSSFSPQKGGNMGVLEIAEKMKELGLMDSMDVDWILDLEEALHCYSLLTCPLYLDIVHKFFEEIYADLVAARNSMLSQVPDVREFPSYTN